MKYTILFAAIIGLCSLASAQQTGTTAVLKNTSTNALTGNLVVPTGKSITINSGGSIVTPTITGNVVLSDGSLTLSTGNVTATLGTFSGNGSGLTALSASNITTGYLDPVRIDTNHTVITPPVAPQFWFDAYHISTSDPPQPGAAIASWMDMASSLNAAVTQSTGGSKPTYAINERTRLPCVRFDGGDYLSKTNQSVSATSGHTVIVVQRCEGSSSMAQQCFFAGGDTSWFAWAGNHTPSRIDVAGQGGSGVAMGGPAWDRIGVMAYRVKASAVGGQTSCREYWVGQTKVAKQDTGLAIPTTLQFSHLGAYINGTLGFTGDIFEIIAFSTPLTDNQLAAIVLQLERKWDCEHGMMVLDGNSLFSGSSGSNGIHYHLRAALGRKWWVTNRAVSGQTTEQMRSDFSSDIAPFLGPRLDGKFNICVNTELRNHLGSVSYASAWSEYQSYQTDVTSAGGYYIATTLLPATAGMPTGNWTESNRLQGNTDIRATYTGGHLWDWEAAQSGWIGGDGVHLSAGIGEPAAIQSLVTHLHTYSLDKP